MSITDELRKWAKKLTHWWYDPVKGEYTYTTGTMSPSIDAVRLDSNITAIADRIDEQHVKARDKAYDKGVYDGIDADKNAMGYIKAPVDADGVPIRIGDTMEWLDGSTAEVIGIGDGVFFYKDDESDAADWSSAEGKRHVKPDSWERIIQDAVKLGYADYPTTCYEAELVERCRRLAGE